MRYQRKPEQADAAQWNAQNAGDFAALAGRCARTVMYEGDRAMIPVGADAGVLILTPGDWLVRHASGRVEKVADSEFTATWGEITAADA